MRVGMGYDVHKLVEGRKLIIGGVEIPHSLGLLGHSDADVLLHAIMDALLGAAALGDIGKHFPDTDPAYKGISSVKLLVHVAGLLKEKEGTAGRILEEFGVEEEALEQLINKLIAPSSEILVAERTPVYSPRARKLVELAVHEAENQQENEAGTEHLLLAMLKETDCVATRLLYTMGVNIQKLYTALLNAMGIENPALAEELHRHWTSTAVI